MLHTRQQVSLGMAALEVRAVVALAPELVVLRRHLGKDSQVATAEAATRATLAAAVVVDRVRQAVTVFHLQHAAVLVAKGLQQR